MTPDLKTALVGISLMYQFADITSTNKAIAFGLSEGNGFIAKVMRALDNFWWLVKIVPMWFAFWMVWDNPLGFYVVFVASCVLYHWVVFGNNLPAIAKWRARRNRNKRGVK